MRPRSRRASSRPKLPCASAALTTCVSRSRSRTAFHAGYHGFSGECPVLPHRARATVSSTIAGVREIQTLVSRRPGGVCWPYARTLLAHRPLLVAVAAPTDEALPLAPSPAQRLPRTPRRRFRRPDQLAAATSSHCPEASRGPQPTRCSPLRSASCRIRPDGRAPPGGWSRRRLSWWPGCCGRTARRSRRWNCWDRCGTGRWPAGTVWCGPTARASMTSSS